MARVIAVANLKGGTGKSTTVANLACAWGRSRRVLVVDLDPQADLTAMFALYPEDAAATIDDVFTGRELRAATVGGVAPGVDLVPAGPKLAAIELTLFGQMNREHFLADALEGQVGGYDVVLVDCPPQLGTLTPNALFSASEVIVPVAMTDRGAYNGAAELLAKVDEVCKRHPLRVSALVRTEVDRRRRSYAALNAALFDLKAPVAETEIPLRAAFNDAGVEGRPLTLSAPDSPGGVAYWKLAEELGGPPLNDQAVA